MLRRTPELTADLFKSGTGHRRGLHDWECPLLPQHSLVEHKHLHFCGCLHAFKSQAANPASKWALHILACSGIRMLQVKAGHIFMLQK